MKNFWQKGITFLETMIIVAIITIMAAIVIPQFLKIKQLQVLKNAGEDIVSAFNKARSQTLASLDSSAYGVHFQSDRVIIFKGTSYLSDDVDNKTIDIVSPATISNISLTGGVTDFYFNRLTGTPSKTGTITISIIGNASLTKTLTISTVGSISIN